MTRVRSTGRSGFDKSFNANTSASDISPPEFTMSAMRTSGDSTLNAEVASHEKVARRAFELYQQSGCAPGRCKDNWAQAESDLNTRSIGGV